MVHKRKIRISLSLIAILCVSLTVMVFWLWNRDPIPSFLRSRITNLLTEQLKALPGAKLEKIDFKTKTRDLFRGRVDEITVILSYQAHRFTLQGNLTLKKHLLSLNGTLEANFDGQRSLHSPLILSAGLTDAWKWNEEAGLQLPEIEGELPPGKSRIQGGKLDIRISRDSADLALSLHTLSLDGQQLSQCEIRSKGVMPELTPGTVEFSCKNISLSSPDQKQQISLDQPRVNSRITASEIQNSFHAESGELLSGSTYLELPLQKLQLSLNVLGDFSPAIGRITPAAAHLRLRLPDQGPVLLKARIPERILDLSAGPIHLPRLLDFVESLLKKKITSGVSWTDGILNLSGQFHIQDSTQDILSTLRPEKIFIGIQNVSLTLPAQGMKIRNASLDLPLNMHKETQGSIRIESLSLKRLKGELGESPLTLNFSRKANGHYSIHLKTRDLIPLSIPAFPVKPGVIEADLDLSPEGLIPTLQTSARLPDLPLESLGSAFCVDPARLPPAVISADFSSLQLNKNRILTQGEVTLKAFDGSLRISNLNAFRIFSAVPETHFDTRWDAIRLDFLGSWLNFGQMDGTIDGYLKNVILQAQLPTQVRFLIEVKPMRKKEIIFSARAMHNLVNLFSGSNLDSSLPSTARFFAFGWPSDWLGGYNIKYAGLSLTATDGAILLETLDPEDILRLEKKHFILYGRRFKIPIQSENYPVILDAYAMANFVQHVGSTLTELQKSDNPKEVTHEQSPICE